MATEKKPEKTLSSHMYNVRVCIAFSSLALSVKHISGHGKTGKKEEKRFTKYSPLSRSGFEEKALDFFSSTRNNIDNFFIRF